MRKLIFLFLILFIFSCKYIPLSDPDAGKEDIPINGIRRAIVAEVSYPLSLETYSDVSILEADIYNWAEKVKLTRLELDIIRQLQGGELSYVLKKITPDTRNLMSGIRDRGALFAIHPQQVKGSSLPADPILTYSEAVELSIAKIQLDKLLALLAKKRPDLYAVLSSKKSFLSAGIEAELNRIQSFPYPLTYSRITHSYQTDKGFASGFENISSSKELDVMHIRPPGLLLKALGLIYGMKKIRIEENFFTTEIKPEISEEKGIYALLAENNDYGYIYLGRLLALLTMVGLPSHLDHLLPGQEDTYRDKFYPTLLNRMTTIISKPEGLNLESAFFNDGFENTEYYKHIVNYLDNDLKQVNRIGSIFERIAQRSDFYPSAKKIGNDLNFIIPYNSEITLYSCWNYTPYSALVFVNGNNPGDERVVYTTLTGNTYTASTNLFEMAVHLEALTLAGMVKAVELVLAR
jgi:hypothetical protein